MESLQLFEKKQQQELMRVLRRNRVKLMSYPGVRELGIGYCFRKGKIKNEPAILVYVTRKHETGTLPKKHLIPSKIEGIRVDVIESNPVKQECIAADQYAPAICGGLAISNTRLNISGTLGAIVFDNATGKPMGLTNHHVLFAAKGIFKTVGQPGDSIVQPSRVADQQQNRIGKLSHGNRGLDAAVFEIGGRPLHPQPVNCLPGPVNGITTAVIGTPVMKSGAATGVTYGIIIALTLRKTIMIGTDPARQPVNHALCAAGDSGSVWFSNNMEAIALHYGGEIQQVAYAHAIPIGPIINKLQVHF